MNGVVSFLMLGPDLTGKAGGSIGMLSLVVVGGKTLIINC